MPAPEKRSTIPWFLIIASVAALLAGVPILAAIIREIEPGRQKSPEAMALERGPEIPERGTFITAHCPEPCRLGTYVKLIAGRTEKTTYLAAYAENAAHDRVWYFPSVSGAMPEVLPRAGVEVLSQAIRLSDEHKSEREWKLHLLLVDQLMTRAALATPDKARIVTETELTLQLGEGTR